MSEIAVEDGLKIAVLLPCRNDGPTIGEVVQGFAQALPAAEIFVFDNNSTDDTARAAARAGAHVFREARPGKGNVVRRMFADIDADIYLMAAGDGSSDPADASSLVNALITEHVDMVVGTQRRADRNSSRPIGDRLHRWLFRGGVTDTSSSYRAFTRRFVRSFPAIPTGLDIEAEMSVHASQLMIPVAEIDLTYTPERTTSARRTLGKGFRTLRTLAMLMKETRPFAFLSGFAMLFWSAGLVVLALAVTGWAEAGIAPQPATVVAAGAMFVIGFMFAGSGLILDGVTRSRVEQKRILFLAVPALGVQ